MSVPEIEIILTHAGAELVRKTLPPGIYVIGRSPEVEIYANTPLLSRRHARLTIGDDHLLLEDLGSSNGTFVNEQPVTKSTRLRPNESVRLGPDIVLEVRQQGITPEAGTGAPAGPIGPRRPSMGDELSRTKGDTWWARKWPAEAWGRCSRRTRRRCAAAWP